MEKALSGAKNVHRLTVGPLKSESKETQIRDSFHSLFGHLEHFEHYIRINLIFFEELTLPVITSMWVASMSQEPALL